MLCPTGERKQILTLLLKIGAPIAKTMAVPAVKTWLAVLGVVRENPPANKIPEVFKRSLKRARDETTTTLSRWRGDRRTLLQLRGLAQVIKIYPTQIYVCALLNPPLAPEETKMSKQENDEDSRSNVIAGGVTGGVSSGIKRPTSGND